MLGQMATGWGPTAMRTHHLAVLRSEAWPASLGCIPGVRRAASPPEATRFLRSRCLPAFSRPVSQHLPLWPPLPPPPAQDTCGCV